MKRTTSFPKLSAEQVKALIDAAPEHVDDPERPYDPNDEKAVEAFWKNAVVVNGGGYEAVRAALAERRNATQCQPVHIQPKPENISKHATRRGRKPAGSP